MRVYVHFGTILECQHSQKARLAPFGGGFGSSWRARQQHSAYRTPVHSVLSAEQKLLHSVQVQTKCSELSVHSVLSARQNLCMSGKCRVHCALCVAWRAAAVQPRLCRMWHTCLACVRFRFCTCATSASGYVDSLPKVTINLISR